MTIRSSLIERTTKAGQSRTGSAPVRADTAPSQTPLPRAEPPHPLRPQLTSKHGAAGSRSVRAGIMARLKAVGGGPGSAGRSWSPQVRAQAQARWGGALSTSQRVIVKAHVARHNGGAKAAGKVLVAHVRYLARSGTGREDDHRRRCEAGGAGDCGRQTLRHAISRPTARGWSGRSRRWQGRARDDHLADESGGDGDGDPQSARQFRL